MQGLFWAMIRPGRTGWVTVEQIFVLDARQGEYSLLGSKWLIPFGTCGLGPETDLTAPYPGYGNVGSMLYRKRQSLGRLLEEEIAFRN